jgi:hypothetical protein
MVLCIGPLYVPALFFGWIHPRCRYSPNFLPAILDSMPTIPRMSCFQPPYKHELETLLIFETVYII